MHNQGSDPPPGIDDEGWEGLEGEEDDGLQSQAALAEGEGAAEGHEDLSLNKCHMFYF